MNEIINKLEKIDSKLKQYEELIQNLIEFSNSCLDELESFGSGYLDDSVETLKSIEKEFKQIKGEK